MNDGDYLKCTCKNCGGHIEFPEDGAGQIVNCPHCGESVALSREESGTEDSTENKSGGLLIAGGVGVLVLAIAAGVYIYFRHRHSVIPAANAVAISEPNAAPKPVVKKAKSPEDLKLGAVQLEKTKGSSLVYAVGSLTNDSDFQRFGVKIELDLLNQDGNKVGTARDYISIIEPHRLWQYRALLTDPKATTAKVATIKEDK